MEWKKKALQSFEWDCDLRNLGLGKDRFRQEERKTRLPQEMQRATRPREDSSTTIHNLPNETLLLILSFLPVPPDNESFVRFHAGNGIEIEIPQIVLLRGVSKRFRSLVLRLDFWYNENFRFKDLLTRSISDDYNLQGSIA